MSLASFINKNGLLAYSIAIVLAVIFHLLGFSICNTVIGIIFKTLYFIILACAILSFYKCKDKNTKSLIILLLPLFLLFSGIPFKVITMIIVFPLFFFKDIKQIKRVLGIILYLIFISFGIIGLIIGSLGKNTIISQKYSPNGMNRVVTIDSDQGALGGDTYIRLERVYFGIVKKDIKLLYHGHWGEKPAVLWVDDNNITINGQDMNIHTSKTWEAKN